MKPRRPHRILIASDGSPSAQAAIATANRFPWGTASVARAVIARPPSPRRVTDVEELILQRSADITADVVRHELGWRWREAEALVVPEPPADAILHEAERFGATIIVVGWRGHGTFRRLLMGSVSRSITHSATCPVLVARSAPETVRRFVVAYDGSPSAECAVDVVASLEPGPDCHALVVHVVRPLSMPATIDLLPSDLRGQVRKEAALVNEERISAAKTAVSKAVTRLQQAGWPANGDVRAGAPVVSLLDAVEDHHADVLVAGARGGNGIEHALLGSVANALLNHSVVPVLLAR